MDRRSPLLPLTSRLLLYDAFLRERLDDSLDVGEERIAIGMIERTGDGVGDGVRVVPAVAVGEDQRGGKVEVIGASAGAVAQEKATAHGVEAEVGASSRIAATGGRLLHITKLSLG